jgi:hypothetical protein
MPGEETKFFLSYAREDAQFALKLAKDLRAAGSNLWVDQLDIRFGDPWDTAVEEALDACGGMLLILSPEAVASDNVKAEVNYALEEKKRVVMVVVRDCKIPFRLRRLQYINFAAAGEETGMAQVREALTKREPEARGTEERATAGGERHATVGLEERREQRRETKQEQESDRPFGAKRSAEAPQPPQRDEDGEQEQQRQAALEQEHRAELVEEERARREEDRRRAQEEAALDQQRPTNREAEERPDLGYARDGPAQAHLAPEQAQGCSLPVQGSQEDQATSEPPVFGSRLRAAAQSVHRWRHRSAGTRRSIWRRAVSGAAVGIILLLVSAVFVAHYPFGGSLPAEARADRLVIEKSARRLRLMAGDRVLKSYWIALGRNDGPKTTHGDGRTPEGRYTIDGRNANSRYHVALHVSYPNDTDRQRAAALGTSAGGDIAIHGMLDHDWWVGRLEPVFWVGTGGDIVVTSREIDEIARAAPDGTPIEIRP